MTPTNRQPVSDLSAFRSAVDQGDAAMDAQRYNDAVADFDRALSMRFDPDVATDRGICLHRIGRSVEALADFDYVTIRSPHHWQARYNKAVVLIESGRTEEARRELAILQQQNPGEPSVQALARVLQSH